MEEKLSVTILNDLPVRKVFYAVEDQNNWFAASDAVGLNRFINPRLVKNKTNTVRAPFDFGEVSETGRLVHFKENHVIYQNYKAKHIVFAEGFGIKSNPFFNKLPLVGNKGEYIIVKAPLLRLDAAIKASFFIVPLGNDLYKVGAPFEVVDQIAGMRPTTGDRRPLVGIHPEYKQLSILNGLGTRGVMAAPMLANCLFDLIEKGKPLEKEMDIMRFPKKISK